MPSKCQVYFQKMFIPDAKSGFIAGDYGIGKIHKLPRHLNATLRTCFSVASFRVRGSSPQHKESGSGTVHNEDVIQYLTKNHSQPPVVFFMPLSYLSLKDSAFVLPDRFTWRVLLASARNLIPSRVPFCSSIYEEMRTTIHIPVNQAVLLVYLVSNRTHLKAALAYLNRGLTHVQQAWQPLKVKAGCPHHQMITK